MPGTIHGLPTDAQQTNITHVRIDRLMLNGPSITLDVTYGTVDADDQFRPDALGKNRTLRVSDIKQFRSVTFDDPPSTRGAAFDRLEKELALHIDTDSDTKWHTMR